MRIIATQCLHAYVCVSVSMCAYLCVSMFFYQFGTPWRRSCDIRPVTFASPEHLLNSLSHWSIDIENFLRMSTEFPIFRTVKFFVTCRSDFQFKSAKSSKANVLWRNRTGRHYRLKHEDSILHNLLFGAMMQRITQKSEMQKHILCQIPRYIYLS